MQGQQTIQPGQMFAAAGSGQGLHPTPISLTWRQPNAAQAAPSVQSQPASLPGLLFSRFDSALTAMLFSEVQDLPRKMRAHGELQWEHPGLIFRASCFQHAACAQPSPLLIPALHCPQPSLQRAR